MNDMLEFDEDVVKLSVDDIEFGIVLRVTEELLR